MKSICLSKENLINFLDHLMFGIDFDSDHELQLEIESSKNWETEINAINYILCQIIQRKKKQKSISPDYIDEIYSITEEFLLEFKIEEIDEKYIDFMLSHLVESGIPLNEYLIKIKEKLSAHDYEQYIRG